MDMFSVPEGAECHGRESVVAHQLDALQAQQAQQAQQQIQAGTGSGRWQVGATRAPASPQLLLIAWWACRQSCLLRMLRYLGVRQLSKGRYVCHTQRRVAQGLGVYDSGAWREGRSHRIQV